MMNESKYLTVSMLFVSGENKFYWNQQTFDKQKHCGIASQSISRYHYFVIDNVFTLEVRNCPTTDKFQLIYVRN